LPATGQRPGRRSHPGREQQLLELRRQLEERDDELAAAPAANRVRQARRQQIDVAVAITLDTTIDSIDGLELVDLPAEPQAASVTHRGPASESPTTGRR
jgi:hypothetical protein